MTLKIHSAEGKTSEGLLKAPNVVHSQDSTVARRSTTKSTTPPPNTIASIRRMYESPENWMLSFTGMGQIHEVSFYINDTFIKSFHIMQQKK